MFDQTKKSSHVHNICKFMSLKNDAVVRTLSILEFDFCFHLEYNPNINSFTSQPFGFHYQFNNRKCRYTPDFLAIGHNEQSTFFEVKHSSQILKPDFRERFEEKQRVAFVRCCLFMVRRRTLVISVKPLSKRLQSQKS